VRQAEADGGKRTDLPWSQERSVRRSAGCLRRTRSCAERTRSSSPLRCFCQGARPRPNEVRAYIEEHRERFGIEPICRTLGVSASACYQRAVGERSARAIEDERLLEVIRATHRRNYEAYGYRRMWKALVRAGERVARCRVLRLMAGAWDPGREAARAAVADHQQRPGRARAGGSGRRDFTAERPNALRVCDFTFCAAGRGSCTSRS